MMKSMTGYGKTSVRRNGKCIEIEIKTLNGKTSDINTKLPLFFRGKDLDVRNMISGALERGKIDFMLTSVQDVGDEVIRINESLLEAYLTKISSFASRMNFEIDKNILISALLRFPDIQKTEPEDFDQEEWDLIKNQIIETLKSVDDFRIQEGRELQKDFEKRIALILTHLDSIQPFEQARVPQIKERIMQRFEELKSIADPDANRFEQELIFYLEKLDITEEKVRLRHHCEYFLETMNVDDNTGKKLGFIAQEMGREINTLGSKANDSQIQKIVVMMKDELEKIKEQVLNIL